MNKQEQFQRANKKITYGDFIRAFNRLNEKLDGEYYCSATDLITPKGKKVPGFVYTGYAAGAGIRNILDAVGIKYITHMKGGAGVAEQSEIYIEDPASQKRFLSILEVCHRFSANQRVEIDTRATNCFDDQWFQQIR
ncbi:MAG TPA: hypothetical protein DD611_01800 [Alphaproteobacteria bacterium]|nr:hypothetical protein [Alphaproteobacteria bacterium]HBS76547.1 hypothetical protein [Alphaproteobacteria bacterium]